MYFDKSAYAFGCEAETMNFAAASACFAPVGTAHQSKS
jgi:hypothetical protein